MSELPTLGSQLGVTPSAERVLIKIPCPSIRRSGVNLNSSNSSKAQLNMFVGLKMQNTFIVVETMPIVIFVILEPFNWIMKIEFFRSNGRTLRELICSESFIFEKILFLWIVWLQIGILPETQGAAGRQTTTTASVREFFKFLSSSMMTQPVYSGVFVLLFQLKFFFSLKVTRLFGPFTKLIKLNAKNLLIWLVFTILLMITGS